MWLAQLRDQELALSQEELNNLYRDPRCVTSRIENPDEKYQALLEAIQEKQRELMERYQGAPPGNDRDQVIETANRYMVISIRDLLFPMWVGGSWDLNGVPEKYPSCDKPVACGHFVQKLLENANFDVRKRPGTWLAFLGSKDIVKSVKGSEPDLMNNWQEVSNYLKRQGAGLYVFGLDAGWGHVGFATYDGADSFWFLHAGPNPSGASISIDYGKHYLTEFVDWRRIWLTRFDSAMTIKWLEESPIVPCVVSN